MSDAAGRNWRSRLMASAAEEQSSFRSLAVPVHRGSTVVFPSQEEVREGWRDHAAGEYSYGIYGTPTARELASRIAAMEGARHTFLVPSGQAAIALIYLSFCKAGSHVLVPWSAYGPSKELAAGLLERCGITAELYDPAVGAGIAGLIRKETALVWCESPGSITMEVQDVPVIVGTAHAAGVPVALDNTYAAGVLFDAFAHGVDVSMQALTKYAGGHSDVFLGSISVHEQSAYLRLGDTHRALGLSPSPDDCSLVLRGLETLPVRLEVMERTALTLAQWLAEQPAVARVLHPALSSCVGHEFWLRDFSGSASIFSVILHESYTAEQVNGFVNALRMFHIGWSWGGTRSLVMAYPGLQRPGHGHGCVVRFHAGLEDSEELIKDLRQALAMFSAPTKS